MSKLNNSPIQPSVLARSLGLSASQSPQFLTIHHPGGVDEKLPLESLHPRNTLNKMPYALLSFYV
ncbi:hypothetical protein IPJ72_03740 [Candidatus Peregrinibacteria bacterium]|nr:MAG: hypothetical protein IPJ72_03740 [Candidatus Peregrinibacteria bacterium]